MHTQAHFLKHLGRGSLVALAALALAACSSTPSVAPSAQSPVAATSPAQSTSSGTTAARQIAITVTGSTISPTPATVPLRIGETLTLTVTSDHADEVHAHGFEVEKEISVGVPTTLVLKGSLAGVYEVEMHKPALTLLQVAVS